MSDGNWIELTSKSDGFEFSAWRVAPSGERKGGLVLIQEIFGVTEDLKRVCRDYAAEGYEVICPSLFDRHEPRVQLDHESGLQKGVGYATSNQMPVVLSDLQACIDHLAPAGNVFMTGYCYGGTLTWLAAANCTGIAAGSGYYGSRISDLTAMQLNCPVILHFGRTDAHIPMKNVDAIIAARPDIPVYVYEAGHGFVSRRTGDHNPQAEALSMKRTLDLFAANS